MPRRLAMACALAGLLAVLAAPPAQADVDLDREVARLVGADATVRSSAYTTLSRANDPAVIAKLVSVLADAEEIAQYYGVLLIQRHPKEGRPALRKLAASRSPHLQVVAGAALWRMGDRKIATTIVRALREGDVSDAQRATMLMRLYSIADPDVMEAVRGFLTTEGVATVVEAAVYNVYISRDRAAVPALKALVAHEGSGVRAMAGAARLVLGDPGGADSLAAAFESAGISTSALSRVRSILTQAQPAPPAVLAAIHAALSTETNAYALRMLVEILGLHGYATATKDIRALLDHEDATVSKAAFEALARLPGGMDTATMRGLLTEGEDARRVAAAVALRQADDDSGLPVLLEILAKGEKPQDRWEAARALSGFRRPAVVPPLLDALADDNSTVRTHAWSSLTRVLQTLFPYRRFDTGSVGYTATDAAARRAEAVKRLRAWWAKHAQADW